ncbi:MAG TPA: hypothetical protein DCL21_00340, partial [Alphaproteobacteria bacterium]|nr:hypothetical protein [Alphaproteobacteria bacterium]
MKNLKSKLQKLLSHILHIVGYLAIAIIFAFTVFTFYLKVKPLDISYLISYLKQENLINKQATVKSLYLTFDETYTIMAKDIDLSTSVAKINIEEARAELSRTSLFRATPSFKRVYILNADIQLDLDKIIASKQKPTKKTAKKTNYHALLKD